MRENLRMGFLMGKGNKHFRMVTYMLAFLLMIIEKEKAHLLMQMEIIIKDLGHRVCKMVMERCEYICNWKRLF